MALVAFGLLTATSGCVDQDDRPDEIVAHAATALPDRTIKDWVTYGDKVVEFRAVSEFRDQPSQVEVDRGEGLIVRHVVVDLGKVRWTRPSYVEKRKLPTTMTVTDGGFVFHGDEEAPLRIEGQPKIEVGTSYLGVLTYASLGDESVRKPSWLILAHIPIENGVAKRVDVEGSSPAMTSLAGKSLDQVASTLKAAQPDPAASKYMADDPQVRFNRVAASR